jgi:hypothetical protein
MHLAPGRNGKAGRHDFGWEQVSNLLDKQPIFDSTLASCLDTGGGKL